MKPRRVIVTLELETDAPLPVMRRAGNWWISLDGAERDWDTKVLQVAPNVIRQKRSSLLSVSVKKRLTAQLGPEPWPDAVVKANEIEQRPSKEDREAVRAGGLPKNVVRR